MNRKTETDPIFSGGSCFARALIEVAAALKERAVRELEEAIAVRDRHEPRPDADGVVVHDSEGPKRPDGTPLDSR